MAKRIVVRRDGSANTVQSYCYGIKYFLHFLNERDRRDLNPETALRAFKSREIDVLKAVDDFVDDYLETYTNKVVRGLL